ncbi:YfiR family protein [Simiduia curdlanivorans]|uniref:YfiR family protein n=2 Tax=Simiduia curdlanivorans TaxID=1492769 RepID=A0ABV8V320_9GAMM
MWANTILMALVRCCIAWAVIFLPLSAQADRLSDNYSGRKALVSYIASLAKHVTWPDSTFRDGKDPIVICVFGADPFNGGLEAKLKERNVARRQLAVRQLGSDLEAIGLGCHQVFISAGEKSRVKEILHRLDNLSVLSLSDMEGFAAAGGMIGFVGSGNLIAMQINRTRLLTSGLEVAPALLRLGR